VCALKLTLIGRRFRWRHKGLGRAPENDVPIVGEWRGLGENNQIDATSEPPHLLVTKDPGNKPLKNVDWFVRSHAITIWPSIANLQVLRGKSNTAPATKPMIDFADPVFSKNQPNEAEPPLGAEALSGLARAFFYAGARSLIVSHWPVNDKATAQLMKVTLHLSEGGSKLTHAQALRVRCWR
jgi:CHAT domain